MHDKLGQTLEKGDYILYARTISRSADLGIGRILDYDETFHPAKYGRWCWVRSSDGLLEDEARERMLEQSPNGEQLTPAHRSWRYYDPDAMYSREYTSSQIHVLSIQGLEFSHTDGTHQWGRVKNMDFVTIKKVRLEYPSRVVKITDNVPDEVVNLLKEEWEKRTS